MVDPLGTPIGSRPVATKARATAAAAAQAASSSSEAAPAARDTPTTPTLSLQSVARELASSAPVDLERVARIRQAIQNRTYPILPETIADRLIALKLNWRPE